MPDDAGDHRDIQGYDEWICSFPNLPASSQNHSSSPWSGQCRRSSKVDDCDGCLKTNGRWTIKEGINDVADPNDAYPASGFDLAATLLPAESTTLDSKNAAEAGGYELKQSCTDALGAGSLRTKPTLDLATNPVSTTVCLPDYTIPSRAKNDLGLGHDDRRGVGRRREPRRPSEPWALRCLHRRPRPELRRRGGAPHDFGTTARHVRLPDPRRTRSCRRATRSRRSSTTASCSRRATAAATRRRRLRRLDHAGEGQDEDLDDRRQGDDQRIVDVVSVEPYAGAVSTRSRCRRTVPRMTTPPFRSARARAAS